MQLASASDLSSTASAERTETKKKPWVTFLGGMVRYPQSVSPTDHHFSAVALLLGATEARRIAMYRGGLLEFVGTALLVYVHIGIVRTASTAVQLAVAHGVQLALFILTTAAPSGGHLNPTITISTTFTGHTSLSRCLLYVSCQTAGSILGATLMRSTLGWDELTPPDLAVCSLGSLTPGAALVTEVVFSFTLLFLAYGIAFDTRQAAIFGPVGAPILIGVAMALLLYASSALSSSPGYAPSMNWAICVGPAVALGALDRSVWIYFAGPMLAALLHAPLFILSPPHHKTDGCFKPPLLDQEEVHPLI